MLDVYEMYVRIDVCQMDVNQRMQHYKFYVIIHSFINQLLVHWEHFM